MTDPASPAAVTEERLSEIRGWLLVDPDFYINCTEREATDAIRDLLAEIARLKVELVPNPHCALSTAGINVQGDEASIKTVKEWMHSHTAPAQSAGEALDPAGSASRASGAGGEKISKAEARLIRHIDNVIASHEPAETECDCAAAKDGLWADVHSPGCAIYGGEVDGGEPDEAMLERGRDVALGLTRVAEENYARGFADGQAAQASALARARARALEEAAKLFDDEAAKHAVGALWMGPERQRYEGARIPGVEMGAMNGPAIAHDGALERARRIRALTEPQHGNG